MKTIARLGIVLCCAAGLSIAAENWRGKLMDADCYSKNVPSQTKPGDKVAVACAPTASTVNFAIETDGKIRLLDPAGNSKAAAAFQDGLLKSDHDGDYHVIITGSHQGHNIKVESIRAHKSDTSVH